MRIPHNDYTRMIAITIGILLVFGVVGSMVRYGAQAEPIEPVQVTPVASEGQDLLVDVAWLQEQMQGDSPPVILDVSDPGQYDLEHIPGAVHFWWQDTMNLNGAGYGEAVGLGNNAWWIPDIGATQDQVIVVYDNDASKYASRVVWQLRTSGFDHAKVLDGGLAAWKGAGYEVSSDPAELAEVPEPEDIWHADNEVPVDQVQEWMDDPNLVIIDTRTAEEQQDTINDTVRLGQIPGSVWIPPSMVMRVDGTFKPVEELLPIFEQRDVLPEHTVVIYGRFGVETGQLWLALRLAGYEDVRVLDDGWIAWAHHEQSRPIEPIEAP